MLLLIENFTISLKVYYVELLFSLGLLSFFFVKAKL